MSVDIGADPERWPASRRRSTIVKAQERIDRAVSKELAELDTGEQIEVLLKTARGLIGYALRASLVLGTRYAVKPSYSQEIREGAHEVATLCSEQLATLERSVEAMERLLSAPAVEWEKWPPPSYDRSSRRLPGERQD